MNLDKNLLNEIINLIKNKLANKRQIMYCDVINYIVRSKLKGKSYDKIIIWCTYNVRLGNLYINF